MNLHPCLDVFLLGSLPHFYLSDPSILNTLEGMHPTEHLHEGGIYFDLVMRKFYFFLIGLRSWTILNLHFFEAIWRTNPFNRTIPSQLAC